MQCWLIVVHFARSSCSPDLLWLRLQSKHAVQSSWLNAYLIIAKINCQKHWFPTKHCAHTMSTFLQFYPSLPYFSVQNFFFPRIQKCCQNRPAVLLDILLSTSRQDFIILSKFSPCSHLVSEMTLCGSLPLYQIKVNIVGCSTRYEITI